MKKLAILVILGGLTSLSLSGCGSSGETTDSTGDGSADGAAGQGGSGQGGGAGRGGSGQGGSAGGTAGQGGAAAGGSGGSGPAGSGGGEPIDANFAYDAPLLPFDELPERCRNAAEKGVKWLASMQQPDGSWAGNYHPAAATALALTKLQTYALEHDQDPFDASFRYNGHITKGFDYLFNQLVTQPIDNPVHDANGNKKRIMFIKSDHYGGYVTPLALMAITAGRGFDQIVRSSNDLNGKTYQEIAQDIVDYFGDCQANGGGWRYTCRFGGADNSVTQYVTLALEYATHPDYAFFCQFDDSVKTGLAQFITAVQDVSGASGYTPGNLGYSKLYRTGALLQELAFLGVGLGGTLPAQAELRADMALKFIGDNFNDFFVSPWDKGNSHYMGMWSVMKGMVTQGLTMAGAHNWYEEYCDKLVAQQLDTGAWPEAAYHPTGDSLTQTMTTAFALLVLEKAAPRKLY